MHPGAVPEQGMEHLVVRPARGQMSGFAIEGKRPIDAQRLAAAFNDASFNPNVGAGGGANWQRLSPTR